MNNLLKNGSKLILPIFFGGGLFYLSAKKLDLSSFNFPNVKLLNRNKIEAKSIKPSNLISEIIEIVKPSVVEVVGEKVLALHRGSGIIIHKSGLILTTAEITKYHSKFDVILEDGTKYEAEVILKDEKSNLSMLKINLENLELKNLNFPEKTKVKTGEFILTVGNHLNLKNKVTLGIISGFRKSKEFENVHAILTDIEMTTSNLGGPLVNLNGELIGVISELGVAVGTDKCIQFVNEVLNNEQVPEPKKTKILEYLYVLPFENTDGTH